jgi:hypothetical protein
MWLLGFWSGFIPRAIAESLLIGLTLGFTHIFNNYIVKDKELKKYTKHVASYIAGTLSYPFLVRFSFKAVVLSIYVHSCLGCWQLHDSVKIRIGCWLSTNYAIL